MCPLSEGETFGDPLATPSPTHPDALEVRVHLTDGSVEKFNQSDPQTLAKFFDGFSPSKVFNQRHLAIDTPDGVFAYPTSSICLIEFIMNFEPAWVHTPGRKITVITAEEFRAHRSKNKLTREDVQKLKPGDPFTGHVVIELANASKAYMLVETEIPSRMDQRMIITHLLQSGTLIGRYQSGGIGLINGDKIVRLGFYPGAPDISPDAWKMNCL